MLRSASSLPTLAAASGRSEPRGTISTSPRASLAPAFSSKTILPERPVELLTYSPSHFPTRGFKSDGVAATGTAGAADGDEVEQATIVVSATAASIHTLIVDLRNCLGPSILPHTITSPPSP